MDFTAFHGRLDLRLPLQAFRYKRDFRRGHPEYFDPDGILVFCGAQGQGKTISAVSYVIGLVHRYPAVCVCTNVELMDMSDLVFAEGENLEHARVQQWLGIRETGKQVVPVVPYDGVDRLTTVSNGYAGVIYLIDEMHLEFNSLESKQMDSNIFYNVSQQRKQRKHIVGTSQVFQRLAKPFREQFKYAVLCRCFGGILQHNQLVDALKSKEIDGKIQCDQVRSFWWFHDSRIYAAYDTRQVIQRTRQNWLEGGKHR